MALDGLGCDPFLNIRACNYTEHIDVVAWIGLIGLVLAGRAFAGDKMLQLICSILVAISLVLTAKWYKFANELKLMIAGPAMAAAAGALTPLGWLVGASPEYQFVVIFFALYITWSLVIKGLSAVCSIAVSSITMAGGSPMQVEIYNKFRSRPVQLVVALLLPGCVCASSFLVFVLPVDNKAYWLRLYSQIHSILFFFLELLVVAAVYLARLRARTTISEFAQAKKLLHELQVISISQNSTGIGSGVMVKTRTSASLNSRSIERRLSFIVYVSLTYMGFNVNFGLLSLYYAVTLFRVPDIPQLGLPVIAALVVTGWMILPLALVVVLSMRGVAWAKKVIDPVGLDFVPEKQGGSVIRDKSTIVTSAIL